jgi:DnaJ-domain-containing protein 1
MYRNDQQTGGLCHLGRHAALPMDPPQMETLLTAMMRQPQTTRNNSQGHHHAPKHHNNPKPQRPIMTRNGLNDPAFCSMVGRSMSHSLKILGLGLDASETEIKVHYRQLARKYHPDKNMTVSPLGSQWKKQQNFSN